jgi:hypothetical protein
MNEEEVVIGQCQWCEEPILPGEKVASWGDPLHWECGLRSVIGGLNHQMGICTCRGGTEEPDPPDLSRREAAQMAAQFFYEHGGGQ